MEATPPTDVPVLTDLDQLAARHRQSYRTASPWPHVVLEDLVDPTLIADAERQELEPGLELKVAHSHREAKAESPEPSGPAARAILDAFGSPEFVTFLEDLTGIPDLVADPTHYWTGLHVNPPGAFQSVHRDFRRHPVTGLFHRLTVIVYLNSQWSADYGGELELWRSDASTCERRIEPIAGRTVIFGTTPAAIHGIPDPVRCPPGRARLSLVSDYFTVAAAPDDRPETRVRRPKRPQDPWNVGFAGIREGLAGVRQRLGALLLRHRSA